MLEPKASYSALVSAVNILFATKMSMIKQENTWQRVGYYLEVGIIQDFL